MTKQEILSKAYQLRYNNPNLTLGQCIRMVGGEMFINNEHAYFHPKYENYSCDFSGNVYRGDDRIYPLWNSKGKYLYFYIKVNNYRYNVVCSRFIAECVSNTILDNYTHILHKDENKLNLNLDNLLIVGRKKLIYGFGINDTHYPVRGVDGKLCPLYNDWVGMIERCHSKTFLRKNPTYRGTIICEEWKYFSNFRKWVLEEQPNKDWENCELDKDLLSNGTTKEYSPITCCFISHTINTFISDHRKENKYVGVSWSKQYNKWKMQVSNPLDGTRIRLLFDDELEAHLAWKAKKHEIACEFANSALDRKVADALRSRYSESSDWSSKIMDSTNEKGS